MPAQYFEKKKKKKINLCFETFYAKFEQLYVERSSGIFLITVKKKLQISI